VVIVTPAFQMRCALDRTRRPRPHRSDEHHFARGERTTRGLSD
jgi:hypothetical protein